MAEVTLVAAEAVEGCYAVWSSLFELVLEVVLAEFYVVHDLVGVRVCRWIEFVWVRLDGLHYVIAEQVQVGTDRVAVAMAEATLVAAEAVEGCYAVWSSLFELVLEVVLAEFYVVHDLVGVRVCRWIEFVWVRLEILHYVIAEQVRVLSLWCFHSIPSMSGYHSCPFLRSCPK